MSSTRGVVIPVPARRAFAALQAVSEPLAARLAERWFCTPPRSRLSDDAATFIGTGRRFELQVEGRSVVGWEWGASDHPIVYLVHGWGGRGGRLGSFAGPLLELGYRVVTFDAPGHGASGHGLSSMPEFARALGAVAERQGPAYAVIAHSLGGSATALAADWGFTAGRYALLAPAADAYGFTDAFGTALGARAAVMDRVRANIERRLRVRWTELDVARVASRMTAPALVVHDRDDDIVPFAEGAAIAASWPGARLVPTSGQGHRGLVRDPGIVTAVVRFVTGTDPELRGETAELEYELFNRESRWG